MGSVDAYGTRAAAHLDIQAEKTAASIRSVASSFLIAFENIRDTESPFSVRDWVENETNQEWLFLHSLPAQRASLTPLLTSWISIAARSLLNTEPSRSRRLWFILDELPSLNKIKDLEMLITEGRKYGACAVLSLQSPAQLEAIYGHKTGPTLIGNCSTKIVFSEQDPQISQLISKAFGEREILEYNEGLSYGANDIRDGVNLSSQKKSVPVVTPTQIQSLSPNSAFLRLPGNWPVANIKFSIAK